ncbi:MAG: hypothetical protein IJ551_04925 [Prevotella sp.]|nr:hypothetical protein [Prevotella sp.]
MTNILNNRGGWRYALAAVVVVAGAVMTGCKEKAAKVEQVETGIATPIAGTSTEAPVADEAIEAVVDGQTLTYGAHQYTVSGEINPNDGVKGYRNKPTASVTFTNVPADYAEFEAVYNGLLGKSVQGTAAMIPMAIELYARQAETGERCLQLLCNSQATVSGIVRILKTKLVASEYGPENDSYLQRYMAAALLKGASSDNAYTPSEPYTVEMCPSVNKPQAVTGGTDTFLYILAPGGWDTMQRGVEVFQATGSDLYKVYNCPACYTQCKTIVGTWPGLK